MPTPTLPTEILQTIVDTVAEDLHDARLHYHLPGQDERSAKKPLFALALSSRPLHRRARKHLFHTVRFQCSTPEFDVESEEEDGGGPGKDLVRYMRAFLDLLERDLERDNGDNSEDDDDRGDTIRSCVRVVQIAIDDEGRLTHPKYHLVSILSILASGLHPTPLQGILSARRQSSGCRVREVFVRTVRAQSVDARESGNQLVEVDWFTDVHAEFRSAVWRLVVRDRRPTGSILGSRKEGERGIHDEPLKTLVIGGFSNFPVNLILQAGSDIDELMLRWVRLGYMKSNTDVMVDLDLVPRPASFHLQGDISSYVRTIEDVDKERTATPLQRQRQGLDLGSLDPTANVFSTLFGSITDLTISVPDSEQHRASADLGHQEAIGKIIKACYHGLQVFEWNELRDGDETRFDSILADCEGVRSVVYAPNISFISLNTAIPRRLYPSLRPIFDAILSIPSPTSTSTTIRKSPLKYFRLTLTLPLENDMQDFGEHWIHGWGKLVDDLTLDGRFEALEAVEVIFILKYVSMTDRTVNRGEMRDWVERYRLWGQSQLVGPLERAGVRAAFQVLN